MKKLMVTLLAAALLTAGLFAASYKNNEYQKQANAYNRMATQAFDAGEYDQAVEYSQKAAEYSEMSEAFIRMMVAKADADKQIRFARNQLKWAEGIKGDIYFPLTFQAGKENLEKAENAYGREDYEMASSYAKESLKALAEIKEITPLPQYYVVRPWAESKDCYWNIAGRPYVYNNPTLWENLYQANKQNMKDPSNPDLIYPGMKMEIPSITGEYREGTYSPNKKYDPYSANR